MEHETYLGDGVYARFNGNSICLDLRGQDNTTRIYLEPEVLADLIRFGAAHGMVRPPPSSGGRPAGGTEDQCTEASAILLERANLRFTCRDNCNVCGSSDSRLLKACGHHELRCQHPRLPVVGDAPLVGPDQICDWYKRRDYSGKPPGEPT